MSDSMEEPILGLRALSNFITSILNEGDEIFPAGSGNDSPPATSTPPKSSFSNPSSHVADPLNTDAEASNSHRPVETKSVSTLATSSSYVQPILNPEPATQAYASGHVKTESTASQRGRSNAFEDLMELAGYGSTVEKKSPSPKPEPERLSTPDPQYPGSPSYSPPASPVLSVDDIVKPFAVSSIRAPDPAPDISSSILLQPGSLYHLKPSPAPPGTPNWKIDLSERKGHRIGLLHVGPRELDILAKCLALVRKAVEKGEECVCAVLERNDLAVEMAKEYRQWDEICRDLEDSVSIDKEEAREKAEKDGESAARFRDDDDDDDDGGGGGSDKVPRKSNGKAKDPAIYGPPAYESHTDRNARAHRHVAAGRPDDTATDADGRDDDDDDDSDDEIAGERGAPRDFGLGSASPADGGMGAGESRSEGSEGTQGVEEVMRFEEEFGGGDAEMVDAGEMDQGGLEPGGMREVDGGAEPGGVSGGVGAGGGRAVKGLRSGGGFIGLYGEEL